MKSLRWIFPLLCLAVCMACNDDDEPKSVCDRQALLDPDLFGAAPSQTVTINRAEIEGDCLEINFSASGCNGDTFVLNLIGAPSDAAVFPPLVQIRLNLESSELCEALITRKLSFDLSVFKQPDTKNLSLRLQNNGQNLIYNY